MSNNIDTGIHHRRRSSVTPEITESEHFESIEQIKKKAEPGEILEFQRETYTHFALYLGQGKVMNIELESYKSTEAHIKERTLEEVCPEGRVRVRNHEYFARAHFQLNPRPASIIVREAESFKDKKVPYEFDLRNCEHYCTLWRYGEGFNTQESKHPYVPVCAPTGHSETNNIANTDKDGCASGKLTGIEK